MKREETAQKRPGRNDSIEKRTREMKNKNNRMICKAEYVKINGIDQFLFHRGASRENPVLLFLHGGPGSAESLFTDVFQEKWEEIYTVVHWDQRGAGKTLTRNPHSLPTIELMLQDLAEVIQYLKKEYHKEKIVLLGHSWGSVLGSVYIRKHPEDVEYYIGTGQVISMLENERTGYQKVKSLIEEVNDQKSLKQLERIGEYPGDRISFDSNFLKKCNMVRKLQGKYKVGMKLGISIWMAFLKSPIFRLSDITAFLHIFKANRLVYDFLGAFNLLTETRDYQVPVYYILGEEDWQVPYVIARDYFAEITAPDKKLYLIPKAGHFTMMDQPALFYDALAEIHGIRERI